MTKAFTIIPLPIYPWITQIVKYTRKKNYKVFRLGYPLFAQQNQYKGVLDSCPFGPGLSKLLNGLLSFRQDWHQNGTAQSCCVILGFITQSKYLYGALREAYLPKFQVFLLLEPRFIPAGFALRKLPSSQTKLDTPLEPTQLRLCKQCYLYFRYKGESVEGVLTHDLCYFSTH